MPNSSIKNERVYLALRRKGYSKTKAAKISNSMSPRAMAKGKGRGGLRGRSGKR